MKTDLNALKTEVLEYMEANSLIVFHGYSRLNDEPAVVHWDSTRKPDYRDFLTVAKRLKTELIVFHHGEFTRLAVEDALARLEDSSMPHEESRDFQRRLEQLGMYEGFTCSVELSFDHGGRIYIYAVNADWYEEFLDILDTIDTAFMSEEDGDEEGPMGGYFSRN